MIKNLKKINIYDLENYDPSNIFANISNKHLIIYSIILIFILYVAIYTNKFSYVFICMCLFGIFIYYVQKISFYNNLQSKNTKSDHINRLNIPETSFVYNDDYLIELLYSARFMKVKQPILYDQMIKLIENFLIFHRTLKLGINNIFLKPTDMIKPHKLNIMQRMILLNDFRDLFERILKHIQTFIHVLPDDDRYLNSFYEFNQLIKNHLNKYYHQIRQQYNYVDFSQYYQLNRSSEDKYGPIDWDEI